MSFKLSRAVIITSLLAILVLQSEPSSAITGAQKNQISKAIRDNNFPQFTALIKKHGVNVRLGNGDTPLIECATYGRYKMAKWLLDKGADTQLFNEFRYTALKMAKENTGPIFLFDGYDKPNQKPIKVYPNTKDKKKIVELLKKRGVKKIKYVDPSKQYGKITYNKKLYKKLLAKNKKLKYLNKYKDSPEILKQKLKKLALINKVRKRFKARPLEYDLKASRFANFRSRFRVNGREVTHNLGHWNHKGQNPVVIWGLKGGEHYLGENYHSINYSCSSTRRDCSKGRANYGKAKDQYACMIAGFDDFMDEEPDNGGHFLQIINKAHTHVGFGVNGKKWKNGDRRISFCKGYEHYTRHYLKFDKVKRKLKPNQVTQVKGQMTRKGWIPIKAELHWWPLKHSEKYIRHKSQIYSYSDHGLKTAKVYSAKELNYNSKTKRFSFPFKQSSPGHYVIQIFVKGKYTAIATGLLIEVK